MYIGRNFSARGVLSFSGTHLIWLTLWGTFCVSIYEFTNWHWLAIPWLPISIVGTAVAFYVGFKNNSSYDRMWEARKIWGGIVNDSRLLGISVRHYINDLFAESKVS